VGTVAHNPHVGNMARALYEVDSLAAFYTGGIDIVKSPGGRFIRRMASSVYPPLDSRLRRRHIPGVPQELIFPAWGWEGLRLATRYLNFGERLGDQVWERSELALDRRCARILTEDRFDAYLGVEHGALSSLQAAHTLGKKSVVSFLSPHHAIRAEWVDPEYERFPELLTPSIRKIRQLAKIRDARRDEEARTASVVYCASTFTAQSLIRVGLATPERLSVVPPGCPEVEPSRLPNAVNGGPMRFVWSGTVAVHKGIRVLLEAWKRLNPNRSAELHIYGALTVSQRFFRPTPPNVVFHGPVTSWEIRSAYQQGDVLVFPTLCDGFGMVVGEAFSSGLPVITTPNAGAADLIRHGDNGFLVPPRDAEQLAERLEWCLDHPEQLRAMGSAARQTALGWSWRDFRRVFRADLTERLDLASPALSASAVQ
jgi:glycosyltransferase involved in cell wall biosynthesis